MARSALNFFFFKKMKFLVMDLPIGQMKFIHGCFVVIVDHLVNRTGITGASMLEDSTERSNIAVMVIVNLYST